MASNARHFVSRALSAASLTTPCHRHQRFFTASAMEFDFNRHMMDKVKAVNQALEAAVPLAEPQRIHEAMRHSLLSEGKRIRGVLCLAACELLGGTEELAMPGAVAVEMIHATTLIQDDLPCMDDDDLRRGRPSCHRAFGEATAILAGDALTALAFEHLANAATSHPIAVSADRVVRSVSELARCFGSKGLVAGQAADLESTGLGATAVSLDRLEYIQYHKTGVLAECCGVIGAYFAGGTEDQVGRIRRFCRCLGLLGQVVDDILDVTKTTEELGKTAGKDLASDKTTYPKLLGMEKSREVVRKLVQEAKDQLVGFDPVKANPLLHMVNYLACRQK